MKDEKTNQYLRFVSKNMVNFDVFQWNISSSISLFFLKSEILKYIHEVVQPDKNFSHYGLCCSCSTNLNNCAIFFIQTLHIWVKF